MEDNNNNSSNSSICGSIETVPASQQHEQDLMDPKEEFGMFADDGMKSSSTSPLEDALLADPDSCGMCGETLVIPRVLSCLHVFCEQCLDRKLMGGGETGGGGDAGSNDTSITCPTCNQETNVGTLKLAALPFDITSISPLTIPPLPATSPTSPASPTSPTISTSPPLTPPLPPLSPSSRAVASSPPPPAPPLLCTSCTTREPAVARCSTCHHLLCANCDKAHRYMRLFETHRVHTLEEDLVNNPPSSDTVGDGPNVRSGVKRRVGMCDLHNGVEAVWYCATCSVLCCGPCGKGGVTVELEGGGDGAKSGGVHGRHQLEGVQECETRVRRELDQLLADARAQSHDLQTVSAATSDVGSFEELAQQRTSAKDLITETCHSYKAVLERCRDRALDELQALYKERELKLMDMTEKVGKDISSLDDACRFTSKLLTNGTISDILYLRRMVTARLQHLVRNTGRLERHYSLEFRTDLKQFEHIARKAFGYIVTERDGMDCMDEPPSPMMGAGTGGGGFGGGKIPITSGNILTHQATSPPINLHHNNPFTVTNGHSIGSGSNTSPINSLPTTASMQSSFDGSAIDLQGPVSGGATGGGGFMQQQSQQLALAAAHTVAQINGAGRGPSPIVGAGGSGASGGGIQGFSSIAEYNLAQLASLAEHSSAPGSIASATSPNPGAAAGHGSSPFVSDMFHNDTVLKNLQSLAKLGLGNDHSTVNGHQYPHALTNGHHHHQSHNMLLPSNGQHHHHRSASPGGSATAGSTITINTQLFAAAAAAAAAAASVSAATSPLLSAGTPDGGDMMGDGMGNGGAGSTGGSGGSGGGGAITRVNKVCPMQIRCKFGQLGATKGQFNSPHGFCLGLEEDIVVADTNNHRIQIFEKTGTFKFQFGMAGKDEGQLWYPRKVAVMRGCGKYVVCDRGNERSRMQIFTKNGHFLKKIAIRYIDIVAGLAVTAQGEIVAVDSVSPTVFVISENGDLLRWFDCSDYMREPSDIAIHGKEFYVCDFKGHNVVVFSEDGAFKRRIGWEAITSYPNGIDISDAGDVLIGDSHGNRFHVAVFSRDGPLISEFECPYVKVSRCCGLKITSEGYVVTLAKNNHHVLVLNTLYIL